MEGEDYRQLFRVGVPHDPTYLPLFAEVVRLDRLVQYDRTTLQTMALGLLRSPARFEALSVLNLNGNVIGVSAALAAQLRAAGHGFDFADAFAAARALLGAGKTLRIGVPFAFSMHRELLHYWLGALGADAAVLDIRTVPPPLVR